MTGLHTLLAMGSGGVVGFVLGLVGGGGSILAVPLLVYAVGVPSPHVAIGTSAIAVAASAAVNLVGHARAQTVKWPCAVTFAIAGMIGAAVGAQLGKMVDGTRLLTLFGFLMVAIGLLMLRPRKSGGDPDVRLTRETMLQMLPSLLGIGLAVGGLSGFFGIGGGFLDRRDRHAADQRDWFLAGLGYTLRVDHCSQLCLVGPRRLAAGRIVYRGRSARRPRRHSSGPSLGCLQTCALTHLFRHRHHGRHLRDYKIAERFLTRW